MPVVTITEEAIEPWMRFIMGAQDKFDMEERYRRSSKLIRRLKQQGYLDDKTACGYIFSLQEEHKRHQRSISRCIPASSQEKGPE